MAVGSVSFSTSVNCIQSTCDPPLDDLLVMNFQDRKALRVAEGQMTESGLAVLGMVRAETTRMGFS
jgi:hypothetical protein